MGQHNHITNFPILSILIVFGNIPTHLDVKIGYRKTWNELDEELEEIRM